MAAEGLPPLAAHDASRTGRTSTTRRSTSRRSSYYSAPKREGRAEDRWTRSTRSCSRPTTSSASRCTSARASPGVAVDAVFDSVSVATTFKEQAGRGRRDLLLVLRGGAEASGAGASSISAPWCRTATTSSPRSIRRCSPTAPSSSCRRACAARWSCPPISASTPRTPASSSAR